jgi:hypothetical protein
MSSSYVHPPLLLNSANSSGRLPSSEILSEVVKTSSSSVNVTTTMEHPTEPTTELLAKSQWTLPRSTSLGSVSSRSTLCLMPTDKSLVGPRWVSQVLRVLTTVVSVLVESLLVISSRHIT